MERVPDLKPRQEDRRRFCRQVLGGIGGALIGAPAIAAAAAAGIRSDRTKRPNFVFIVVDDLRPMLGCYGAGLVQSPNIDRLAARGVIFERAYCQNAVCSPSRTSMLTGLRPDSTRVFDNGTHFRVHRPNAVTLPQHLRQNGYHSLGMGKVFHSQWDHAYVGRSLDDPLSWSDPAWYPDVVQFYFTEHGQQVASQVFAQYPNCRLRDGGFCLHSRLRDGAASPSPNFSAASNDEWKKHFIMGLIAEAPDVPDSQLYDGQLAEHAIAALPRLKSGNKPFFLSLGFTRPHVPYVAPKRYWELYDPSQIILAANSRAPVGAPRWALLDKQDNEGYQDFPEGSPVDDVLARRLIHGYMACVAYTDAQIGKVLAALDRLGLSEDTVVVLTSDHGYHLGENSRWGKQTCFESATRVPLIVSAPTRCRHGCKSSRLVESVDVFPTLCELASVLPPAGLEGTSFVPLLEAPDRQWKRAAFSQFPRPVRSSAPGVAIAPGDKMGYALRTERYRYVEWRLIDRPRDIAARELYDYEQDPLETRNLAEDLAQRGLLDQFHQQLERGWRGAIPSGV